jgi:hypothetical protein
MRICIIQKFSSKAPAFKYFITKPKTCLAESCNSMFLDVACPRLPWCPHKSLAMSLMGCDAPVNRAPVASDSLSQVFVLPILAPDAGSTPHPVVSKRLFFTFRSCRPAYERKFVTMRLWLAKCSHMRFSAYPSQRYLHTSALLYPENGKSTTVHLRTGVPN